MEKENREIFISGAKKFGIQLDEMLLNAFDLYLKELLKWNQKINLTAIRSEKDIIIKHFLDSLSIIPYLPPISTLLDIGSGAGFPGIPIKMVKPSLEIKLIDSRLKKVDFQRHVIQNLGLKGIEAIHGRIEDKKIIEKYECQFDVAVSRAFSSLENLLFLGYPYLKKKGLLIAMKGRLLVDTNLKQAYKKEEIQFHLKKSSQFILPFSQHKRTILIFEKD